MVICLFSVALFSLFLFISSFIGVSRSTCVNTTDSSSPLLSWTSQALAVDIGIFAVNMLVQVLQMIILHRDCQDSISPFWLTMTINLIALLTSLFNLASSRCYVCKDIFG